MKKTNKPHHLAITLIFSSLMFTVLLTTLLIVSFTIFFLLHFGAFQWMLRGDTGIKITIFVMALSSLVVGTVVSFILSKRPLKPINTLIWGMNSLAGGNYKTRISLPSWFYNNNEYSISKKITESFNTLAAELENTEMLRNDFINNFSHEFKTPIVSIAGFAKLIRKGGLSDGQKEEYLEIIEKESLRLSHMATNVLTITNLENQTILTDVAELNLSEQLRKCVLLLEKKWNAGNIDMNLEFAEYFINANEEMLKQVWINLIDNAVKFTPNGGSVYLSVNEEENNISVSVTNTGDEIPQQSINKIFRKFYQADESHSNEGNGIGLAIVKRVVELHSGTVSVESRNGRTTFKVELPKKQNI
ncbi:MAG: HAMP domain-containing histidine kinase [Clostridiales bacterium]|nr:HAMP domain-containing histidine kinase [Clostridiales bacterium]